MTDVLPRGVAARVERQLLPEPERPLPTDPVQWVNEDLGEFTWSHQQQVMRAVVKHRKVAWQACHGPGKSFTASRLIAWWIMGHPPGSAMAISTAPSGDQVRKILWKEIRAAHLRAGLPGYITDADVPEWKIDGSVVAFGRKPQDYKNPQQAMTQFQGQHARYILVVLDEATGVPAWLWDAVRSLLTNNAARVLAIGNPDDPTTEFETVCRPGSGWHVQQTSVYDTPNFTGEYVPEELREMLPGRLWVDDAIAAWGETSPMWISKGLGEFPEVSDDVVITPKMIREAHERDLPGLGRGRFAMDIARHGIDETCIYRNRDGQIRLSALPRVLPPVDRSGSPDLLAGKPAAWRGADTTVSTGRARAILDAHGGVQQAVEMAIDVVGMGWSVFDPLARDGHNVRPFVGGEAAREPRRFVNRRSEAWWMFREACTAGLVDLDPADQLLAAQLQQPKWKEDAGKRIRIETKDEMKTRGIKGSPDRADTVVMSWYEGYDSIPDPDTMPASPDESDPLSHTADLLDRKW